MVELRSATTLHLIGDFSRECFSVISATSDRFSFDARAKHVVGPKSDESLVILGRSFVVQSSFHSCHRYSL